MVLLSSVTETNVLPVSTLFGHFLTQDCWWVSHLLLIRIKFLVPLLGVCKTTHLTMISPCKLERPSVRDSRPPLLAISFPLSVENNLFYERYFSIISCNKTYSSLKRETFEKLSDGCLPILFTGPFLRT